MGNEMKQAPRCEVMVSDAQGFYPHKCMRPVFEGDKCKIHCASAVAARRAKRDAKYAAACAIRAAPYEQLRACAAERDALLALVKRIQDALGTGEEGENLVAVTRDAARAEMELAAIKIKLERGE